MSFYHYNAPSKRPCQLNRSTMPLSTQTPINYGPHGANLLRGRPLDAAQIRPTAETWTIPRRYDHWIRLRSSMTREIERVLGAPPEVYLCYEGPDRLSPWEAAQLGLSPRGRAFAREIALLVAGTPVMLARSLTAIHDPAAVVLRRLQRAPLAEVLFRDTRWQRASEPMTLRWRSGSASVPGRACLWQRARPRGQVLVEEYFLPPLVAGCADQ